jgi:beta-glucosidase
MKARWGRACEITAREAIADGIHGTYAPMLDIARDPRWGRIIEGFGEDPYLTGQMAEASIKGYQKQNLAACAKHYVGYGANEGGRDYGTTEISDIPSVIFICRLLKPR